LLASKICDWSAGGGSGAVEPERLVVNLHCCYFTRLRVSYVHYCSARRCLCVSLSRAFDLLRCRNLHVTFCGDTTLYTSNWDSKFEVKGQGHWERECKCSFSRMPSSLKLDQITSNQEQNDAPLITHISLKGVILRCLSVCRIP